jgi:hypothetical protein
VHSFAAMFASGGKPGRFSLIFPGFHRTPAWNSLICI